MSQSPRSFSLTFSTPTPVTQRYIRTPLFIVLRLTYTIQVGGLPTQELNKLELQFLLLNDFRLAIPPDELHRYFERLLASTPPSSAISPTATSPSIELFGMDYSPRAHPSFSLPPASPPPLYTPPADAGFEVPSPRAPLLDHSADSSVAPTPNTIASHDESGVLSSSSASTITQITYSNAASEAATPVAGAPQDEEQEEDDPTIRVSAPGIVHSQYSSYANTDLSSDSEQEGRRTRDESPAASLRYVDGQWGRGAQPKPALKRMPSEDSEGHLTEDEVVYRGTSSRSGSSFHARGRSAA